MHLDTREMAQKKDISKNTKKNIKESDFHGPSRGRPPKKRAVTTPNETQPHEAVFHAFGWSARLISLLIVSLLLLQPVVPVFASEEVPSSPAEEPEMAFVEKTVVDESIEEVPVVEEIPAADGGSQDSTEATNSASESVDVPLEESVTLVADTHEEVSTVTDSAPDVPNSDPTLTTPVPSVEDVTTGAGPVSTDASSTDPQASQGEVDSTATTTTENAGVSAVPDAIATTSSESVVVQEEPILEEDATTTPEDISSTTVAVSFEEQSALINDYNRYQFGVNECVTVADGFFYCTKHSSTTVAGPDRFFAAQDSDGDFEIFLEKEGETTQITHNLHDDSAPYYDAKSDTLVWHALIDDRWQIMRYDLAQNEMSQVTNTTYNNMEPVAYGDRMVWQAWIGSDWEIMLLENGELSQLTENDAYDIDPHVRDNLVSWQTRTGDEWKVVVYDIETEQIVLMEAHDGASVENPRFVLLYDSVKANGDQETVGYDLKTKKVTPLGAAPAQVPDKIPQPEHEKETRALVQTAPQVKEDMSPEGDTSSSTPTVSDPPPDLPLTGIATATDAGVDVLSSTTPLVLIHDVVVATSTEDIPVVDMRPLGPLTTIPDVVITPRISETETSPAEVQ